MSWKATAFVKGLTRNLTHTQKLVLFVLADYHHTTSQAAWPSIPSLAEEAMLSERGVYNILRQLEYRNFIKRVSGGGRGNVSKYVFVGLDNPANIMQGLDSQNPEQINTESSSPKNAETLNSQVINPERNPEQPMNAIRKEPVYERVEQEGAPDLPPIQLARGLLEKLELTRSEGNMRACAFAIEAVAQARGSPFSSACDWLCGRAQAARKRGDSVNRWWFEEGMQKWESNGNGQVGTSKAQERTNSNREVLLRTERACAGTDAGHGVQRVRKDARP